MAYPDIVELIKFGDTSKSNKVQTAQNLILRTKCKALPSEGRDEKFKGAIKKMFEIIYDEKNRGIGLAAPQAGITYRFFIMDWIGIQNSDAQPLGFDLENNMAPVQPRPLVCINPEITAKSKEKSSMDEGCLSLPGINVSIDRPDWIHLRFSDENGILYHYKMTDLLGTCVQHEIDHLNGRLIVDHRKINLKKAFSKVLVKKNPKQSL